MYFRNQNREQIFFFSKLKTLSMSIMSYPDIAALAAYLILLPPIHSEYLLFSPHWGNHCDSLGTELSPSSEMVSAMISQLYCEYFGNTYMHTCTNTTPVKQQVSCSISFQWLVLTSLRNLASSICVHLILFSFVLLSSSTL